MMCSYKRASVTECTSNHFEISYFFPSNSCVSKPRSVDALQEGKYLEAGDELPSVFLCFSDGCSTVCV